MGFVSCGSDDEESYDYSSLITDVEQANLEKAQSESSANANKTEMG